MAGGRARRPEPAGSVKPADVEGLLSLAAAAAEFAVPRSTLTRAARVGNLEARRLGNQWVTTAAAVRAWLRGARHRPGPGPERGAMPAAAPAPIGGGGAGALDGAGGGAPPAAPAPPGRGRRSPGPARP